VRRIGIAAALVASLAVSGTALAATDVKFPSDQAACVAKAWVPANTDPDEGRLGAFISDFAHTGEWGDVIRQEGCK
jgi:hypothetical protein